MLYGPEYKESVANLGHHRTGGIKSMNWRRELHSSTVVTLIKRNFLKA
jgi:hypothetical protein